MDLASYVGFRFRTIPYSLTFTVLRIRPRTVLVFDDHTQRVRTLPRAVVEEALREKKLVYLGMTTRRSA